MQIQNPSAAAIIREQAGLTLSEGFPQNLSSNVVPVMDMTPALQRKINFLALVGTTGTTATLISANSGKRYLIHGFSMGFVKDAAFDGATGNVAVAAVIGGVSYNIARMSILTLTAQNIHTSAMFPFPLEIDFNSQVTFSRPASTAGTMRTDIVLYCTEIQ